MSQKSKQLGLTTPPGGTWVQTDRAAHERWAQLAIANPRASSVLCGSAWKKDPGSGVIGVEKGPLIPVV